MNDRRRELAERLGRYRATAGRELEALTEATAGEQLVAVVYAAWRRRAWIVAATDRGLRGSRRPRIFGRDKSASWSWFELGDVRAGAQRVDLVFGDRTLELNLVAPHEELVKLVEFAREQISGAPAETRTEDLRELARHKLGRTLAFGYEAAIDGLPDRLHDDERVERVAVARLDFHGLLVVTDRRVILSHVGLRRASDRFWELDREEILQAEATEDGLRLTLRSGEVELTAVLPDERREELAAALWRG